MNSKNQKIIKLEIESLLRDTIILAKSNQEESEYYSILKEYVEEEASTLTEKIVEIINSERGRAIKQADKGMEEGEEDEDV